MVCEHQLCPVPGEQLPFNLAPRLPSKQNRRSEWRKRVASASNRLGEFVLRTASHNARANCVKMEQRAVVGGVPPPTHPCLAPRVSFTELHPRKYTPVTAW